MNKYKEDAKGIIIKNMVPRKRARDGKALSILKAVISLPVRCTCLRGDTHK